MLKPKDYILQQAQKLERNHNAKIDIKVVDYGFKLIVSPQKVFDSPEFGLCEQDLLLDFNTLFSELNLMIIGVENI